MRLISGIRHWNVCFVVESSLLGLAADIEIYFHSNPTNIISICLVDVYVDHVNHGKTHTHARVHAHLLHH